MNTLRILCCILLLTTTQIFAQQHAYKIHSHNDYKQELPFWEAYNCGLNSIEADVYLKNGMLYVTHSKNEIDVNSTLENMYLIPLQKTVASHLKGACELQILIDIKSEAYSTLKAIGNVLIKYPSLINGSKLVFVVSGNRPAPKDYGNYPDYIQFDYQSLDPIPESTWNKVALISLSFNLFSSWNGIGEFPESDLKKVKLVLVKAHSYHKPFRFWGTPDTHLAWQAFYDLGVDFINTDHPSECSQYFKKQMN